MPFDIKNESEFIQAVANGKLEVLSELLAKDPSRILINTPASNGCYPLMIAAGRGQLLVVEKLLKEGAEIDAVHGGATALWFAVARASGNREMGNWEAARGDGGTAQQYWDAAERGWKVAKSLLAAGAKYLDASLVQKDRGGTVLWMAVMSERKDLVELLLQKKCNVNMGPLNVQRSHQVSTPLLEAAHAARWDIAECLLKSGADILDAYWPIELDKIHPTQGKTALWWTIVHGNDAIFRDLLTRGASLSLSGNEFTHPSCLNKELRARNSAEHSKLRKTFDAATALFDIASSDSSGFAGSDLVDEVKQLQESIRILGPALNGRFKGKTALQVAIEKGKDPVIKALVLAGAYLSPADRQNEKVKSLLGQVDKGSSSSHSSARVLHQYAASNSDPLITGKSSIDFKKSEGQKQSVAPKK